MIPVTVSSICYGNGSETSDDYRYGYQGQESDDEVKGNKGTSYTTEFRQYDPRVGRWLSVDPLAGKYADINPYAFVLNSPMIFVDLDGQEVFLPPTASGQRRAVAASNRLVRAASGRAGMYWQPVLQRSEKNTLEFVKRSDKRKARKFIASNINSDNEDKRVLATFYQSIIREESSYDMNIRFDDDEYDKAMKSSQSSKGKRIIKEDTEKDLAAQIEENCKTMNPIVSTTTGTPAGGTAPSGTPPPPPHLLELPSPMWHRNQIRQRRLDKN